VNATLLSAAVVALRGATQKTMTQLQATSDPIEIASINRRLMFTERCFLNEDISPEKWFNHVIWAPSPFDSYEGSAFFAVYNANKTATRVHSAQFLADRIAQVIEGAADFIAPDYFFE